MYPFRVAENPTITALYVPEAEFVGEAVVSFCVDASMIVEGEAVRSGYWVPLF
jgi:hypothetical protein